MSNDTQSVVDKDIFAHHANIRIDKNTYDYARSIGEGNMSLGFRRIGKIMEILENKGVNLESAIKNEEGCFASLKKKSTEDFCMWTEEKLFKALKNPEKYPFLGQDAYLFMIYKFKSLNLYIEHLEEEIASLTNELRNTGKR